MFGQTIVCKFQSPFFRYSVQFKRRTVQCENDRFLPYFKISSWFHWLQILAMKVLSPTLETPWNCVVAVIEVPDQWSVKCTQRNKIHNRASSPKNLCLEQKQRKYFVFVILLETNLDIPRDNPERFPFLPSYFLHGVCCYFWSWQGWSQITPPVNRWTNQ